MMLIHYPEPAFRVKKEDGKEMIFDSLRKKWLLLTPEEWVRQNFVQYLITARAYPAALIALEKVIRLGELKKRFDILVYDNNHRPWLMVECKSTTVTLDEAVLQQALRYNISVPVEYIIITNGVYTYGWRRTKEGLINLSELPVSP